MSVYIKDPGHQLTFDGLDLVGDAAVDMDVDGYCFGVVAEGTDFGEPTPIVEAITSWLQDGALAATLGDENRVLRLQIWVKGVDARAQAQAEQELFRRLNKFKRPGFGGVEVVWRPPDFYGDPVVFDVVAARQYDPVTDDMAELRHESFYAIELEAAPWVRSTQARRQVIPAVQELLPPITVDDGTDAGVWQNGGPLSHFQSFTGPSVVAQGVQLIGVKAVEYYGRLRLHRSLTGVVIPSTHRYVRVRGFWGGSTGFSQNHAEVVLRTSWGPVSKRLGGPGGWIVWLTIPENSSLHWIHVQVDGFSLNDVTGWDGFVVVTDIVAYETPYGIGYTGRQSIREFEVGGAARTPGRLSLRSESPLDDVLIFTRVTSDSSGSLTLQDKRTAGPPPATGQPTVSGIDTNLNTQHKFTIPVSTVAAGRYQLWARIRGTANRTVTWATRYKMGGTESGDMETGTKQISLSGNNFGLFFIGAFTLPPKDMGSAGEVLIRMVANGACDLDEAWLLDVTHGQVTAFTDAKKHVWVEAPSIQNGGIPKIWTGDEPDQSDALEVSDDVISADIHELHPGRNQMLVVTSGATDAVATWSYYHRSAQRIVDED